MAATPPRPPGARLRPADREGARVQRGPQAHEGRTATVVLRHRPPRPARLAGHARHGGRQADRRRATGVPARVARDRQRQHRSPLHRAVGPVQRGVGRVRSRTGSRRNCTPGIPPAWSTPPAGTTAARAHSQTPATSSTSTPTPAPESRPPARLRPPRTASSAGSRSESRATFGREGPSATNERRTHRSSPAATSACSPRSTARRCRPD